MKENGDLVTKKRYKPLKIIVAVIAAAIILCGVFFGGYFTYGYLRGGGAATYEWAVRMIDEHYCGTYKEEGSITIPVNGYTADELSLKALAGKLDDYSEYYTASEYAAVIKENSGERSGVGVSTNYIAGKGVYVVSVAGGSPAFKKGVHVGDTFVAGEAETGGRTSFGSAKDFATFISARQTGEKFTLYTADGAFELSKEEYTASYTTMYTSSAEWGFDYENGREPYYKLSAEKSFLPENTAMIKLSQFYGNAASAYGSAAAEFGKLMGKFNAEGYTSLILDLRNNGGGYVSVMQDISGYFLSGREMSSPVAMTAEYKSGYRDDYLWYSHSGDGLVKEGTKIYVLANANTASASEALIGVLVSYGILEYENIFISDYSQEYLAWAGENAKTARSYGKGIMQTTFKNYATGEALKLTTAKIFWPNGKCIHDVGLTAADGCRLAPAQWTATRQDEELKYVCQNYLNA